MKIPKLFKKAAAFVMAAVTALSIMPATAFAAGDIGTISFSHTYDSKPRPTPHILSAMQNTLLFLNTQDRIPKLSAS